MGLVLWSETTTCYDLPEAMRKHSYYGLDGNEKCQKCQRDRSDYNAQQYVALQEGFIMDRIVDARNPNYNLKLESRNSKL